MPVLALINQKGGSGKTTVATNLAYALKIDGQRVLLVDADPQGSVRDWNEANGGELLPVVGLDRETLPKDFRPSQKGTTGLSLTALVKPTALSPQRSRRQTWC